MTAPQKNPPQDGETLLRVGSSSDAKAVASAITQSIFEGNSYPVLRAIGHGAVGQAVKALAIARGSAASRGTDLAVLPGFTTIQNDAGEDISAIVLKTFPR